MRFKLLTISSTRETGQSAFSKLMNSVGLRHFSLVRRTVNRMSSTNSSYEDAIRKLNSLQSNKQTIEQIKKGLKTGQKCTNIEDMQDYLQRVGIPLSRLDDLSVIHVAGTKGKGSTSAMCESILRRHGFRTGFYSSPHLVAARERVRLGGRALSRDEFAESLHRVYGLLWDTQKFEGDMPKYFAFLTVLAYHVFLRRRVDVAVVEVGIGGVVDYTNVLRKVDVVGISALGLDHTSILGSTLPEIAAAKAGVMKRGCRAYTVRQPRDAARVLADYADYVQCPLTVVPDFASYEFPETGGPLLPVDLDAYRTNASLAIQLSHAWMRAHANRIKHNTIPVVSTNQNGLDHLSMNGVHTTKENTKVSYVNGSHDIKLNGVMNKSNDIENGTYNGHNGIAEVNTVNGIQNTIESDSILQDDPNRSITNTYKYQNNVIKVIQNGSTNMTKSNGENHSANGYITNQNGLQNDITNTTNKVQNGLNNGAELNNASQFNNHANHSVIQNVTLNGNDKAENSLTNGTVLHETNHSSNNISDIKLDKNQNDSNDIYNGIENETLSRMWKDETGLTNGDMSSLVYEVPLETAEGLKQCRWPGRYQVVETEYATFYLDGAHTRESMEICAQWFMGSSSSAHRVLIFSATGDRNSETLLRPLTGVSFKQIYFVIPTAHRATTTNNDNYSLVEQGELIQRCNIHSAIWRKHDPTTPVTVLECVADALHSIQAKESKPSVLITGSLHLVGAALSILDPNLSA